jgi:hypothetical protein
MSTEIIVRREARGGQAVLVPDTVIDGHILDEMKGDTMKAVLSVPRNLKFHRKFFALLGVIYDYMEQHTREEFGVYSTESLLNRLKIDLGLYTLWIVGANAMLPMGTPVYIPDSISFAKMDNDRF